MNDQQTLISPAGLAVRPRLHTADKQHHKAGMFHTRLLIDPTNAPEIIAVIDEARMQAFAAAQLKAKNPEKIKMAEAPYRLAPEHGKGYVDVKFRVKALAVDALGFYRKHRPEFFDRNGKQDRKIRIGDGDTIRVGYIISPYNTGTVGAGVALRLLGVQLIKSAADWRLEAPAACEFSAVGLVE